MYYWCELLIFIPPSLPLFVSDMLNSISAAGVMEIISEQDNSEENSEHGMFNSVCIYVVYNGVLF